MGETGSDLKLSEEAQKRFPYYVECRNRETWSISTWAADTQTRATAAGLRPLLIVSKNRYPTLAILPFDDLAQILEELEELRKAKYL